MMASRLTQMQRRAALETLDASLAAQIRALETLEAVGSARAARDKPARRGLVEDERILRQATAAWLFWRAFLAARTPTHAGLLAAVARLRGVFLWKLARLLHDAGLRVPLSGHLHGKQPPPWTLVAPSYRESSTSPAPRRRSLRRRVTQRAITPPSDPNHPLDDLPIDATDAEIADWWAQYGDLQASLDAVDAGVAASDISLDTLDSWGALASETEPGADAGLFDLSRLAGLIGEDDLPLVGDALSLADLIGAGQSAGFSDLQIAQLLDASWNGQASLWAGQDMASSLAGGMGIGGAFSLQDPFFSDYLRQQTGYLISGIDETTRSATADLLWSAINGVDGFGPLAPAQAARFLSGMSDILGNDLAGMSASRAYTIAVTEMARAESFGQFAALWASGARQKQWMTTTGACEVCADNELQGPVLITDRFPSGDMMPPAHRLCRCAGGPVASDTFNPDEWQSRDPSALAPYLFSWDGAVWPQTDLSGLADDWLDSQQLAAAPDITRAAARRPLPGLPWAGLLHNARSLPHHGGKGDAALIAAMHASYMPLSAAGGSASASASLTDLGALLRAAAEEAAARWFAVAGEPTPEHPDTLRALSARVKASPARYHRADTAYRAALTHSLTGALATWRSVAKK